MAYWYRTGTIAVSNGSTVVAGTLTGWTSTVRAGDELKAGGNPGVEIASVGDDNVSLTLVEPWPYTSLSPGSAYAISQGPGWNDVTRLAVEVSTALANSTEIISDNGVPSDSVGSDGSAYFRQDAPELYFKNGGTWGSPISLTGPQGPAGATSITSSTTSRTIGTGSMAFTVDAGKAIQTGMRLRVSNSGSNYMEGVVTSYSSTTLTLTMDLFVGSGTFASWNIGPAGDKGSKGDTGASYAGTSTTSLAVGTGSQTLTTQAGLAYVIGSRVRVASSASPANFMEGVVTAYATTSMTVNVDVVGGSGTIASWNLSIAGIQGAMGNTGSTGSTGATGPAGPGYAATSASSNSIGTGNKTFTTQAGLSYVVGSRARAADSSNPATNWMEGVITAYSSTSMTIAVDTIAGSGTITSWNISLAGSQGAQGIQGIQGVVGPTYNATSASTLTPATGSQSFTVATGLPFLVGQRLRAASAANLTTNWMSGIVASYSSTTLTLTVDLIGITPVSASDWNLSLTGEKGDQGPAGGFGSLDLTKGNIPVSDGSQFGVVGVGADGTLPQADSTQSKGLTYNTIGAALAKGARATNSIASAATVDLSTATTDYVIVTGSTGPITSFGTAVNKVFRLRFASTPTITYNGTSLITPGLANIAVQAGDECIVAVDGSSNAKIIDYTRANGGPPVQKGPTVQVFTSSGTWTKPAGCVKIRAKIVGGGGGGGGAAGGTASAAAGGGASGAEGITFLDVTSISSLSVTVGAAGNGAAAGNNNGSQGGTSGLGTANTNGAAPGGAGGGGVANFLSAGGTAGGSSVVATGCTINLYGQPGGIGTFGGVSIGGNGGSTSLGGGALGPTAFNTSSNGAVGLSAGGGGSGGAVTGGGTSRAAAAGGNGAAGIVIIEEYYA